jgi:hypothetical protein
MAQISPKLFSQDLAKQIFPDNVFYTKGSKDIAAGNMDSVDIPIAGIQGVAKSGTPVLPLTITERADDIKNYALTQVWAEPILVKREEDIVLNYNKQADVARVMGEAIATKCADITANAWGHATATLTVPTSGAARTTTLVGATLTRKAITKVDLMAVRNMFMKQNISLQGIIGVVTPDQYNDILGIAEFVDFEKTGVTSKLELGIIGRILGMDIMVRWNDALGSIGLHYDAVGVKKANGVVAATDCAAALFFQPNLVRFAEAFPETIINRKPAGYLGGTVIEAVVRFGATQSRGDGKGVVVLREIS